MFALSTILGASMIFFDGAGVGLVVVLLDGIGVDRAGGQASAFDRLPVFGGLAETFNGLSSNERLQTVAVLLALLAIVRGAFTYFSAMAQRRLVARVDLALRRRVFARIMQGAIGDVGQEEASWHYNLLTSFPAQAASASGRMVPILGSLFSIAVIVGYVALISIRLTVLAIVLLGVLMLVAQRMILPRSRRAGEDVNLFYIDYSQFVMDTVYGLLLIRMFARESARLESFDSYLGRQFKLSMRAQRWTSLAEPIYTVAVMVSVAAMMFVGSQIIAEDAHRIPTLIAFILILSRLIGPVGGLNEATSYIAQQSNSVSILCDFIDDPPGRAIREGTKHCPPITGRIEFRNVGFRYRDDRPPVLQGVSFSVAKGCQVALVGPSGGGKTTIIRMLARLIDPIEGSISVDGVDLRDYTAESWRRQIGIVPQDTYLFNDTIAANLRFAKPTATDEELVAAAKAAHAHGFIMDQEKGYQTIVGDRGALFSGGQQQRLSIARALLAQPHILVLDEATSNLDSESEAEIKKAIAELAGRRTVIIIAHHLSTIRNVDQIVVIANGRVAEEGRYDELVARAGLFSRLVAKHDTF